MLPRVAAPDLPGTILFPGFFSSAARWKLELELRHPHFSAAKFHAFHLQTKALVQASFTGDGDASAGSHHAMPGKSVCLTEHSHHHARSARNPGGTGHGAIA